MHPFRIYIIVFLLALTGTCSVLAQNSMKYYVFFTNKQDCTFDPYAYFDSKAIERRQQQRLPLCDSTDFPLNATYVDAVVHLADTLLQQSRWFNAVIIRATAEQLKQIQALPFVKHIEPAQLQALPAAVLFDSIMSKEDLSLLAEQTSTLQMSEFSKKQITGKKIRIAVLDGGFPGVNTSPAFAHVRKENRIIKTWDFVRNTENVYHAITHGTMVLSCIAGRINNIPIGMAPDAEFLLARTEMRFEPFSEEENWLAAAEWADKHGAQIINSSLGYTFHRYFNNQMDGKTSMVAKAATMAARKGILVVNAAGNEGVSKWHWIVTPADADSIITVGGIDPATMLHTSFSSYGPTSDKRIKPNVSAYGHVMASDHKGIQRTQGTSFAAPLIAGFAACVMQMHPDYSNLKVIDEIQRSATLFPYYDYAHGYGIPKATYFTTIADISKDSSFTYTVEPRNIIKVEFHTQDSLHATNNYFYYNIQTSSGYLEKYYVIDLEDMETYTIDISGLKAGYTINMHYLHTTESFTIKE